MVCSGGAAVGFVTSEEPLESARVAWALPGVCDPRSTMRHEAHDTSVLRSLRYGAASVSPARDGAAVRAAIPTLKVVVYSLFVVSAVLATLVGLGGTLNTDSVFAPRRALGDGELDASAAMTAHEGVDVSLPVLVLGLPKAGTTSLAAYFACGGLRTSHYVCMDQEGSPFEENESFASDGSEMEQTCGRCIRDALVKGNSPLETCGRYEAWAQMDVAGKPNDGDEGLDDADGPSSSSSDDTCFFPQVDALDALDLEYPRATFVLNKRASTEAWMASVDDWNDLRARLRDCDLSGAGFPSGEGGEGPEGDAELVKFVQQHEDNVRVFVKAHPSHKLVEVTIEDPNAGAVLENAFGIPKECWGNENVNDAAEQAREGLAEGDVRMLVF